jgi:lambda family phage minor tail protein L
MTLEVDVQQGWHSAIIEMFDIDLSPITGDINDIFYYTNQVKPDESKIQWKGKTYEPLPLISSGYEKTTTGQIAQPTLTVSNLLGTFTEIVKNCEDLVGGKVTRRRTFAKYLDGEIEADILQEFPIDVFYIERKTDETIFSITWQLSSAMDLEGLQIPRRVITQNHCLWKYRSSECGYTGAPVFNVNDEIISTDGLSSYAVTVVNAWKLNEQRKAEYINAVSARNKALETKLKACDPNAILETKYSRTAPLSYVTGGSSQYIFRKAYWNGTLITLNQYYRQGILRETISLGKGYKTKYYEVENWGGDPTSCALYTARLAAADAALAVATTNYNNSDAALSAALTALPANDPLWSIDVCGKRIKSCQLHFPATQGPLPLKSQSLPYGGFPGANLSR